MCNSSILFVSLVFVFIAVVLFQCITTLQFTVDGDCYFIFGQVMWLVLTTGPPGVSINGLFFYQFLVCVSGVHKPNPRFRDSLGQL